MARNIDWYYFQGKASWSKVQVPDLEYKNWTIRVHLNPESLNTFNKLKEDDGEVSGILNEVKRDDDGDFVNFKRPMFKNFGSGDEPLAPPEVLDCESRPMKKEEHIGNGSDVTIKCECYKYNKPFRKGKGRALRMVAVKVDNLVPYTRADFTERQEKAVEGLDQQPKQTVGW